MVGLQFDFLQLAMRAEAECKDARARLGWNGNVQGIGTVRQLDRIVMRTAEPVPRLTDGPEIAVVVITSGEQKVSAISSPLACGLGKWLSSTCKNRVQTRTIRRHFPDRLRAIFTPVHAEANRFPVGRPGGEVRQPRAVRQFMKLRSVGMDGVETAAANKNDLASVG